MRSGQMLRPSPPALGQLRNRNQPRHLVAIARVDAEDIPDSEVVIGLLHDPDLVSGAHIALDDDSEIGAGPERLAEATWKRFVVHPYAEPPAGMRGSETSKTALPICQRSPTS